MSKTMEGNVTDISKKVNGIPGINIKAEAISKKLVENKDILYKNGLKLGKIKASVLGIANKCNCN